MASIYTLTRRVAWVFVALVLVLFGVMGLAAISQAQEQPVNETAQDSPDEEIAEQLGDLVIHSYDYSSETNTFTVEMTWTGRAPETATLTEMLELDSGGSTQISFQRQRLRPQERTEITMDAEIRSGGTAAIMVTTTESVDNGEAVVLQDGDPSERPAIRFGNVILAVGSTAVLASAGTFAFVLYRKHDDERGVERIA